MAKIKLSNGGFSLIPEGVTVFKVMSVDDSGYEEYGNLKVELQTASGLKHIETFSLIKKNGELNQGALNAWSYFAKNCLNNFSVEEIDTQDIVGCYVQATVKHEKYIKTKGANAGKEGTNVRLNDYTPASGFAAAAADEEETEDDLDDFLNE